MARGSSLLFISLLFMGAAVISHNDVFSTLGNPFIQQTLTAIAGVLSLCFVGCYLHLRIYGDISVRKARREIHDELRIVADIIRRGSETLREIEQDQELVKLLKSGTKNNAITQLARFIDALQKRADDVSRLVATKGTVETYEAYDLLAKKLSLKGSVLDSLIESEPMEPVPPSRWEETLEQLCLRALNERRRLAA